MKKEHSLILLLFIFFSASFLYASEDTIDLSGLLPGGGKTFPLSGTYSWNTEFYSGLSAVTTYTFNGANDILGLRSYGAISRINKIFNIATSATLDISTINWHQLQMRFKIRGNPDPTYGASTLLGVFQPECYSAFWPKNVYQPAKPGVNPAYIHAISYNTVDPFNINYDAMTFGRISTWVWFSYRFICIPQDFPQLGYFGIKYSSSGNPPFWTELQIDEIKLEAIRFR